MYVHTYGSTHGGFLFLGLPFDFLCMLCSPLTSLSCSCDLFRLGFRMHKHCLRNPKPYYRL